MTLSKIFYISSFIVPIIILYLTLFFLQHESPSIQSLSFMIMMFSNFFTFWFLIGLSYLFWFYDQGYFRNGFGNFLYSYHKLIFFAITTIFMVLLSEAKNIGVYYDSEFIVIFIMGIFLGSVASVIISLVNVLIEKLKQKLKIK